MSGDSKKGFFNRVGSDFYDTTKKIVKNAYNKTKEYAIDKLDSIFFKRWVEEKFLSHENFIKEIIRKIIIFIDRNKIQIKDNTFPELTDDDFLLIAKEFNENKIDDLIKSEIKKIYNERFKTDYCDRFEIRDNVQYYQLKKIDK